jgi:hypothetical protein
MPETRKSAPRDAPPAQAQISKIVNSHASRPRPWPELGLTVDDRRNLLR